MKRHRYKAVQKVFWSAKSQNPKYLHLYCTLLCFLKWTPMFLNTYLPTLFYFARTVHENMKDYTCKLCGSEFSTVSGVKRHIQIHHEIVPTKVTYFANHRSFSKSSHLLSKSKTYWLNIDWCWVKNWQRLVENGDKCIPSSCNCSSHISSGGNMSCGS